MIQNSPLSDLSTELLLKIFNYLDIPDLCRLRRTCKRFNEVISSWDHIILKGISPLVTNQKSTLFLSKCVHELNNLEKVRISRNWIGGRYAEKSLLFVKKKHLPWLHLEDKCIWLSRGRNIYCYGRNSSHVRLKPILRFQAEGRSDVVQFQKRGHTLVGGLRDGGIIISNIEQGSSTFLKACHESDVNSVDINRTEDIIITGGRDNYFKIWRRNEDVNQLSLMHANYLQDRIWKVSLLEQEPLLAVGTSANNNMNAIFIHDIERVTNILELSCSEFNHGVLDLKWDGPHCMWSCGYDTYLRRWDMRTGSCIQIYHDPHAAALYCLDYDYCNTVMTGTQLHGRVILWDVRQKNCVQLYFMESCKNRSCGRNSPVYSLAFDAESLFTATDQNLNVLNFSAYNGKVNDYSDCCK